MRIHSLDGLRGLAAYIVVLGHFQLYTGFGTEVLPRGTGQVGVMLFFALSGFLMGTLYMGRQFTSKNLIDFYQKRVARVVPLYLIVVAFCFQVTTQFSFMRVYNVSEENLWQHLLFIRGDHVLWTIAVEVQFYLLFPLIWYLHSRVGSMSVAYLFLAVASLALLNYPKTPPLLTYLHVFLIGLIAASLGRRVEGFGSVVFLVSLVGLLVALPGPRKLLLGTSGNVWFDPALMIITPVLIVSSLHSHVANSLLGNRLMTFLGKISYSVYLLHMLVLWGLESAGYLKGGWVGLLTFLVLVTALSWVSYRLIEQPFRIWISGVNLKRSEPPLAG